jgi:Flp pilus assembly pilin Flp
MKTTRNAMRTIVNWLYRWRIWQDLRGQDMVEYALLASLVAVASGLFLPDLRDSMEAIYSRVKSKLVEAGG